MLLSESGFENVPLPKHSQRTMKRWQEHLWERWTSALRSEKHWNAPCLQRLKQPVNVSLSPFRKRPIPEIIFWVGEPMNDHGLHTGNSLQNVNWKQAWFRSSSKRISGLRFHVYGWFLFKSVVQWICCSGILENSNERLSQSHRHCMQWVVRPSSWNASCTNDVWSGFRDVEGAFCVLFYMT